MQKAKPDNCSILKRQLSNWTQDKKAEEIKWDWAVAHAPLQTGKPRGVELHNVPYTSQKQTKNPTHKHNHNRHRLLVGDVSFVPYSWQMFPKDIFLLGFSVFAFSSIIHLNPTRVHRNTWLGVSTAHHQVTVNTSLLRKCTEQLREPARGLSPLAVTLLLNLATPTHQHQSTFIRPQTRHSGFLPIKLSTHVMKSYRVQTTLLSKHILTRTSHWCLKKH